jgi:hypothetical protein
VFDEVASKKALSNKPIKCKPKLDDTSKWEVTSADSGQSTHAAGIRECYTSLVPSRTNGLSALLMILGLGPDG